ncbi:zinc finger protein 366 [Ambystoma mexicanum]|uniref:zinc finger protein 366 n=1 Tax=Ambystoma mexicanum TaxID=8296 RepID=UPI0037E7AF2E
MAQQMEMRAIKKETPCFSMDLKQDPTFPPCFQTAPPRMKFNRLTVLSEPCEPQFAVQCQYNHPVEDFDRFHGAFEGGSHRRKSMATKAAYGTHAEDTSSPLTRNDESKNIGVSGLPLLFQSHPPPIYRSKMIDLCNIGFQLYRTLGHFGATPIKQEPSTTSMKWAGRPTLLHPMYPYCHKVHPGMIFPVMMPPPNLHYSNPFQGQRQAEQPIRSPDIAESEDMRPKMERVDVNIKIDDSYYVDVGGDQKRWKCTMCEKSYTSKYNLVTHILGHSGIKPHACTRCGKLFKQLSHLHTHMLTHQGMRPHKCLVCHKAFTQTSHLKRHMMQHSDVKPYNCRVCGRGFAYPSELKSHESKHESGRENICVECGLDFPTLAQLKRHLTTHRGPIQYNCTECDKSFQYPSQLQNHMMKHKDIRPHICTECGMEFVQPHHLKQHSLTHKGVKEHKCGICGREFTLLANMKRHVLIHTNIRAYQCHLCFKSFVQKQTLKAHMIVHSDVKPFKCKLCGKEFNRMHNLMGHMHLHADSKPFKCLYCPSKFTLKGNLTRHMKVKHGIMERGLHSRVFGRGRTGPSHPGVLRGVAQKEPFDLSQRKREKQEACRSDREGANGSSCQEEEEERGHSPGMYHHDGQGRLAEDLLSKPGCSLKTSNESDCEGKEGKPSEENRLQGRSGHQSNDQERRRRDDEKCGSSRRFENKRRVYSSANCLLYKYRKESWKQLHKRKMQGGKQSER